MEDSIYKLANILMVVGFSIFLLHIIIKYVASKIDIKEKNISTEIETKISELKLETKLILHEDKCSPLYDQSEDTIEIENKSTFTLFCSAFHELGHAYFNKYSNIVKYTKGNTLVERKQTNKEHRYFLSLVIVLLGISAITLYFNKFASIGFSTLAATLFLSDLREEFMSSISAVNMIKVSKYFTKKQEHICCLYLISLLGTYMYVLFIAICLILYNIFY